MLRRHVYVIGVFACTALALLLTAEPASAQLRERLRARFGMADSPRYYTTTPMTVTTMPVTGTATTGPVYMVEESPTMFRPTRGLFGRRSEPMYFTTRSVPMSSTEPVIIQTGVTPVTSTGTTTTPVSGPVYLMEDTTYRTRPARRLFGRTSEPVYFPVRPASSSGTDPAVTRTAFYPSEASDTVLITVRVPANAEILIDGNKMTQQGTLRQFVSPTLERGSTYSYEVQAKWTENGQEVNRTQKVEFQPGQQRSVDFLMPAPRQQ